MTRVTLVHTDAWPQVQRGGERYLHDLAWYLDRCTDVAPTIVTRRGRPRDDTVEGVPVHRRWWLPTGRLGRWPRAQEALAVATCRPLLSPRHADVVQALRPAGARAGVRAGVPTVYTVLGAPNREFARRYPVAWAREQAGIAAADVVTAVSQSAADAVADVAGREVLALPPGLRGDRFTPRLAPRDGPPRVLFASAVEPPNKGFVHLVRAMVRVVDVHPDATLVVIGPGDVEAMLAAAGTDGDRVRGHVERSLPGSAEMGDWYASATATVLASFGEAFGLVLAESLATGTPVVASDVGGPAEIVQGAEGRVGTTVPIEDPDGLADGLLRTIDLARDDGTPAACVDHARQWDWQAAIGPAHERLYADLTGRPIP